ncbi:MAG TPA: SDR family NAD(P)-dependent oxidoreductase [Herpetosiphonaceae bacterium]
MSAAAGAWVVTGCSSGIGAALATALIERGTPVIGIDRQPPLLPPAILASPRFRLVAMDLGRRESGAALAAALLANMPVAVLVNNAAVFLGGPFEELDLDGVEALLAVNLLGAMRATQALLPVFRRQGRGHVINVSSDAGFTGLPFASPYVASKFALTGWSESLAAEVAGFGVRVSLLEICGAYRSAMRGAAMADVAARLRRDSPYAPLLAARFAKAGRGGGAQGDPREVAAALIDLAAQESPPLYAEVGPKRGARAARRLLGDEAAAAMLRQNVQGGGAGHGE